MNPMKIIKVEKVTLNIGAGKSQDRLEKAIKLLQMLTGSKPIKTVTNKRIAGWGIRPGLPIGCKVSLRKKLAEEVLKKMLEAKDFTLKENNYDTSGNISFGLPDYLDVPGMKYDPEIGTLGFQVCITLQRPGYRIKKRKVQKRKIPLCHKVSKEEAISFMEKTFNVKQEEEE